MKIAIIEGNRFSLDGGSMFGAAPKELWTKWENPNAKNQIELACRCLLIQTNKKNILLETGIGDHLAPKLQERFSVEKGPKLLENLKKLGITKIDTIILSHLHFDHAGGLLSSFVEGKQPHIVFQDSEIIVAKEQFERAKNPHIKDRANYMSAIIDLLAKHKNLRLIDQENLEDFPFLHFHYVNGHTVKMIVTEIDYPKGPIFFTADTIPGMHWVNLPISMAFDRFMELQTEEKLWLLKLAHKKNGFFFFNHDPRTAFARVIENNGTFTAERIEIETILSVNT